MINALVWAAYGGVCVLMLVIFWSWHRPRGDA
jgi:hypothetical protein